MNTNKNKFVAYAIHTIKDKITNYNDNEHVNYYNFVDEQNLNWYVGIHKLNNRIHIRCSNFEFLRQNSITKNRQIISKISTFAEGDLYFTDFKDFTNLKLNENHYDKGKDIWKCKNL